jgi:hypothetical protein
MIAVPSIKYDTAFKVAQVVGACGIEGIKVSATMQKQMASIIDGALSASDAKKAILAQYRKSPC